MTATRATVNPNRQSKMFKIGNEKTPVVVVEDFLLSLAPLKEAAVNGPGFTQPDSAYPGKTAPLLSSHIQEIGNTVVPFMQEIYDVPDHFVPQLGTSYYGLAFTPPDQLNPVQCIPHVDTCDDYTYVSLLYINDGDFQGTAFYRYSPSGFERIGPGREGTLQEFARSQESRTVDNPNYYQNDGDFEEIFRVEYKPNRLAIYPGSLLHAPLVERPDSLVESVDKGRLAALFYFRFVDPATAGLRR